MGQVDPSEAALAEPPDDPVAADLRGSPCGRSSDASAVGTPRRPFQPRSMASSAAGPGSRRSRSAARDGVGPRRRKHRIELRLDDAHLQPAAADLRQQLRAVAADLFRRTTRSRRSRRAVAAPAIRQPCLGSPTLLRAGTPTPRGPTSCRYAPRSSRADSRPGGGRPVARSGASGRGSTAASPSPPRRRATRRPPPASSPGSRTRSNTSRSSSGSSSIARSMRRPSGVSPETLLAGAGTSPSHSSAAAG